MTSTASGLASYLDELRAISVAQSQILEGTRSVLAKNERQLSEALGAKIDVHVAEKSLNPSRTDKIDEQEAWVGYDVEVGEGPGVGGFYLGLYFSPVESGTDAVEIYAYGSLAVGRRENRESLWRLVEGATSWEFEKNRRDWSVDLYRKVSPDSAELFTEALEEIVAEWCEIGKRLGGVNTALSGKPYDRAPSPAGPRKSG